MTDEDWEWVELRAAKLIADHRTRADGWTSVPDAWTAESRSGFHAWVYGSEPYYWTRETHAGYLAAAHIAG